MADEHTDNKPIEQVDGETPKTEEPNGTESKQDDAVDWKAKYEEVQGKLENAVKHSRNWESKSKANADKAKAFDEMTEREESATKRAEAAEAELKKLKAEIEHSEIVARVAKETGIDPVFLTYVSGDEQAITKAAEDIAEHMKNMPVYPSIADSGISKPSPMTKEQIDQIKDPAERIKARAENIDLYK